MFVCQRCHLLHELDCKNGPWYCSTCYKIEKEEIKLSGRWADFLWRQACGNA